MKPSALKIKLVTFFILAFLCLNVGGAVCLAYCQSGVAMQAAKDHCPLHKADADCHSKKDAQKSSDQFAVEANSVTCCTLAINVFIAPLEKRQSTPDVVQIAALPIVQPFT